MATGTQSFFQAMTPPENEPRQKGAEENGVRFQRRGNPKRDQRRRRAPRQNIE